MNWNSIEPTRATCQRNDELDHRTEAIRSRVCHTTTAPASTKNSESDDYLQRAAQRSPAITAAPITKATMTVLMAVNRIPIVNNDAATIMI